MMVGLSKAFFELLPRDPEMLHGKDMGKERPYIIVVKLKYLGEDIPFAIPFRSRLSNKTPKNEYKSLPPRPNTPNNKIHGLHYTKMFPVTEEYFTKYRVSDDEEYYKNVQNIINRDMKDIVRKAEEVVLNYTLGRKSKYTPNWDDIIQVYYPHLI